MASAGGRDEVSKVGAAFVSGSITTFNNDGHQGIMSVIGAEGKFVRFSKSKFFVHGSQFYQHKKLYELLRKGSTIKVLMVAIGKVCYLGTYPVQYHALVSWIGNMPFLPAPLDVQYPHLMHNCKENIPPNDVIHSVFVDVPICSLIEQTGKVCFCSKTFGLIAVNGESEVNYVLFTPDILFLNTEKLPSDENFPIVCSDRLFNTYSKLINPKRMFGIKVTYECVLVWGGRKPNIKLVQGNINKTYYETSKKNMLKERNNVIEPPEINMHIPEERPDSSTSVKNECLSLEIDNELSKDKQVSYISGMYLGMHNNHLLIAPPDRAIIFSPANFYVDGRVFSTPEEVDHFFRMNCQGIPLMHAYAFHLNRPIIQNKIKVDRKGLYVWMGSIPNKLKEKTRALLNTENMPSKVSKDVVVKPETISEDKMNHRSALGAYESNISAARPIRTGRVSGYILSASASDAIMTGFTNTVFLSRERFYVNGNKFRGVSLLEYFQKNKDEVYTYLVPMEGTLVRGVMVFSRAVCAWVSSEPRDLQLLIRNNKMITKRVVTEIDRKKTGCFYYFVGRVTKLGKQFGVIECDIEGKHALVCFSIEDFYRNGIKVNNDSVMFTHKNVLLTARWSLLAHYTKQPVIPGVHYTAVAVWHHLNQPLLMDEFLHKISFWHQRLSNIKCDCNIKLEELLEKRFTYVYKVCIAERRETELAIGIKNAGLVWLDRNKMWVDGCSCYFSESDERRSCYIVFAEDKVTPLYAWMGKKPSVKNENQCQSPYLSDSIISDHDSDIEHEDPTQLNAEIHFEDIFEDFGSNSSCSDSEDDERDMDDASDPYDLIQIVTQNSFVPDIKTKKSRLPTLKPSLYDVRDFCGKYITGKLENINENLAILSCSSKEYNGTLFVLLDIKFLYINGTSFTRGDFQGKEENWKGKTCNMYVNTYIQIEKVGNLEVSSRATIGWIGVKPGIVPPPGKQKAGKFKNDHIRIAYSDSSSAKLKFCSVKYWKKQLQYQAKPEEKIQDMISELDSGVTQLSLSSTHPSMAQPLRRVSQNVPPKTTTTSSLSSNLPATGAHVDKSTRPKVLAKAHNNNSAAPPSHLQANVTVTNMQRSSGGGGSNGVSVRSNGGFTGVDGGFNSEFSSLGGGSNGELAGVGGFVGSFCGGGGGNSHKAAVSAAVVSTSSSMYPNTSDRYYDSFEDLSHDTAAAVVWSAADDQEMEKIRRGKIVELHPKLGRILAEDGSSHYFNQDQFYLHGVPLTSVELYLVLLQGKQGRVLCLES